MRGRRRLLVQIILAITKVMDFADDASIDQHSREMKQLIYPVIIELAKSSTWSPENIDALLTTRPTVEVNPPQNVPSQSPPRKFSRRWLSVRSQSNTSSGVIPGRPTEEQLSLHDVEVEVFETLLDHGELRRRLRTTEERYVDVVALIGSKFPAFREEIAETLGENDGMLARVILGNRSLYGGVQKEMSDDVANGSRIRKEILRYMGDLLSTRAGISSIKTSISSTEKLSETNGLQQNSIPDEVRFDHRYGTTLVDTSKKPSQGRVQKAQGFENNEFSGRPFTNFELWHDVLKHCHKPTKAKKRFVWLPEASMTKALICFLGSPQAERDPMSLFFDWPLRSSSRASC